MTITVTEDLLREIEEAAKAATEAPWWTTQADEDFSRTFCAPATILALTARIRELEKDSARYRWLRDGASMVGTGEPWEDVGFVCAVNVCTDYGYQNALTDIELDAAIDAAMQADS